MEKEINIGYNLKIARNTLNLTQKQFGEKLGVSASCIQHWEANYAEPNLANLRKMKEIFNISYDEIIDGI